MGVIHEILGSKSGIGEVLRLSFFPKLRQVAFGAANDQEEWEGSIASFHDLHFPCRHPAMAAIGIQEGQDMVTRI